MSGSRVRLVDRKAPSFQVPLYSTEEQDRLKESFLDEEKRKEAKVTAKIMKLFHTMQTFL